VQLSVHEMEGIIRTLPIVDRSPKAYDLLMWVAKKLDMTKVSSQTDLTKWLRETITEEAREYSVSPRDFAKRFRGMVKFFTDPSLGLEAIRQVQEEVAEDLVENARTTLATAQDIEDIYRFYRSAKEMEFPPLAPSKYRDEFLKYVDEAKAVIARVARSPAYKEILSVLKEMKPIIQNKEYERMSTWQLRQYLDRLRSARTIARDLRESLGIPYTINERSLSRAIRIISSELRKRPVVLRRRPLRVIRRRRR